MSKLESRKQSEPTMRNCAWLLIALCSCGDDATSTQVNEPPTGGQPSTTPSECPREWSSLYDPARVRAQVEMLQTNASSNTPDTQFPDACLGLKAEYDALQTELEDLRAQASASRTEKALSSGATAVYTNLRWVVYEYTCTAEEAQNEVIHRVNVEPHWLLDTYYTGTGYVRSVTVGLFSGDGRDKNQVSFICSRFEGGTGTQRIVLGYAD